MPSISRSTAFLALGPTIAVSLVLLSVLGNSGPGFFIFSLVAAFVLAVVAPIVQIGLRQISRLSDMPGTRFAIALVLLVSVLCVLAGAAAFNQW